MELIEEKIGKYMIGVGCVIEHKPTGKILCLLRDRANFNRGEWDLMYGRVDQHEELLEALHREIREETGLQGVEIKRLLRIWHFYRGEKSPETEIHGFTFHCLVDTQEITISSEHSDYQWLEPEEALKLIDVKGIREDVKLFIENKKNQKVAFSGVNDKIEDVL